MPAPPTDLFLLDDLDQAGTTTDLAPSDLDALRSVADWITTFVARPHDDLGRTGPVCPFVPKALELRTFWLAVERTADATADQVAEIMAGYARRFRDIDPVNGDGTTYKVIVVIFADLPAGRAEAVFGEVLEKLAVPSYVEHGIVFGPFYEGNEGTAIYNAGFRPFQSPVPFLFVRQGVVDDWKFFLDDDEWLGRWAYRFGESGVRALATELRRLPWRARPE